MKTILKRLIRNEKGNVFILVLILLVVGGLILAPLLGLMSTGLLVGKVYENKMYDYYAADAGVEDAIWRIQHNNLVFVNNCSYLEPITVNDRSVNVVVYREDLDPTCGENFTYRILSISTTDDGSGTAAIDSTTMIDTHLSVSYMDFSNLLDNAIVSDTHISIKNGVDVIGPVTSGGTVDDKSGVPGPITENAELNWPSSEDLKAYYFNDVKDLEPPFPYSDPLNIEGDNIMLKALYREGDWTIYNDSNTAGTVTLNGTVYVTGDLQVGVTNKDFTLNLNNQTIFVEGKGASAKSIEIKDKCTIIGTGCIIALGDVYFAPNGDAGSEDDFVLIMSVDGTTTLQPSGTFYGCIAGNVCVEVKSGNNATITHTSPEGKSLDFPMGVIDVNELPPVTGVSVLSWEIS